MTRSGIIKSKELKRNKKIVMRIPNLTLTFERHPSYLPSDWLVLTRESQFASQMILGSLAVFHSGRETGLLDSFTGFCGAVGRTKIALPRENE